MAYGLKAFRHIQISNVESAPGTAEAAVEVLVGMIAKVPMGDRVIHYPEQDRNSLAANLADDFIVGKLVEGSIEGNLNHRIAVWLFSNSIKGNVSPSRPNSGTQPLAYYWPFEPGLTTANTPDITAGIDTFTLEFGDNIQNLEAEYVFTRTLKISSAPNEPVTFTWEWTARQLIESAVTPGLAAVAVQKFPSNTCKFYIDSAVANWGVTQKTGMLRAFTWTLETMFTPRFGADGTLYFYALNEDKKKVELELTYYRDAASELEKDKYDARTTTYLRIKLEGQTEIDSGQANLPYVMLDGAYRYTEWPELSDEDGSTTETVTAQSVYDATGATQFIVRVLTDMSVYPGA